MGAILAKFRTEKTTYQLLENLEEKIKDIEEYSLSTQARQKRYVGNFLVISIGLYVICFIIFYFLFFPPTWMERITYSVPLLIFPMLIFFLKRLVAWYFQKKLNKNSNKLNTLRAEKRKIIEKVMDNETYKVALEILNRFADKTNGFKSTTTPTPRPVSSAMVKQPTLTMPQISPGLRAPNNSPAINRPLIITPQRSSLSPTPSSEVVMQRRNMSMQGKRTPYPIINQQDKGVLEKMVDYLIGDGPHNRFAMICKECFAHNGMALQEEYDYATFRCAFCNALNPSRKLRPVAPKLPMHTPTHAISGTVIKEIGNDSSTSTSEKESESDSDVEQNSNETDKKLEKMNENIIENETRENIATEEIGDKKND